MTSFLKACGPVILSRSKDDVRYGRWTNAYPGVHRPQGSWSDRLTMTLSLKARGPVILSPSKDDVRNGRQLFYN